MSLVGRGRKLRVILVTAAVMSGALAAPAAAVATLDERGSATQIRNVSMRNNFYSPSSITIQRGTRVRWTNNGSRAHTATRNGGGWSSGTLQPGQSFSRVFNVKGTIRYHCRFHSNMRGTIVVR
jgi:plastocyanin